ncbi:Hypothetical predicted protein [Podarcis lilfordi]|uniref:Uncharacterized protein n=1 Tax=Podarcis lilfordi TaxID=74358 RepID=A0AA35P5E3_9SAUR|nr:Hypothetical predicted protein [Podarcis lilfordi]
MVRLACTRSARFRRRHRANRVEFDACGRIWHTARKLQTDCVASGSLRGVIKGGTLASQAETVPGCKTHVKRNGAQEMTLRALAVTSFPKKCFFVSFHFNLLGSLQRQIIEGPALQA